MTNDGARGRGNDGLAGTQWGGNGASRCDICPGGNALLRAKQVRGVLRLSPASRDCHWLLVVQILPI
jgi:hypothetical protein